MLRHLFDAHNGGRPGHKNGMRLPGDARFRCVASISASMRSLPRVGMFAVALAGAGSAQAAASDVTFVQAATRAGIFQTFVGLIDKAQAADRLNAGPATVFMPTDAAFTHLSSVQRDTIASLSPDDARRFVSHFVVPGVVMKSNNIGQDITAEDGTSYNVTWFMGRLSLRDHRGPAAGPLAFIIDGDNPAGPGMIDAVDNVLMPAFVDRPMPPDAPVAASAPPPIATAAPPSPPPSASPVPSVITPAPNSVTVAPPSPAAPTSTSTVAPGDVTFSEPKPAQPAPPSQPAPSNPPTNPAVIAASTIPDINITMADLRGWPVRTSGNGPTGKVDRVVVGVPSGRITGLTATFGGFLGFGGKRVFIAWPLVTIDPQGKAIRTRMTADGLKSAPSIPPAR